MKKQSVIIKNKWIAFLAILVATPSIRASARETAVDEARKRAESQVRTMVEPLLEKYCGDQCKILHIDGEVEVATPEEYLPGFDEIGSGELQLKASAVKVKVLMDQMVGSTGRAKLIDLIQQHTDGLPFAVSIDTKLAQFPLPPMATRKFGEIRERVTTQLKNSLNDLFRQVCPEGCMLGQVNVEAEPVNGQEAQSGLAGEYFQDGEYAIRISRASAEVIFDTTLSKEEQSNILEMARMRTSFIKGIDVLARSFRFPQPISSEMIADRRARGVGATGEYSEKEQGVNRSLASTIASNSKDEMNSMSSTSASNSSEEKNQRSERVEKYEKIERVEQGDAIQKELKVFKTYGLVFACAVLSLLLFIAAAGLRGSLPSKGGAQQSLIQKVLSDPVANTNGNGNGKDKSTGSEGAGSNIARRYEIERLQDELMGIFAEQPKVAKHVFTRVLTEEGIEVTASYLGMFGETIVMDMLRDPSLQGDLTDLMEFFAKNSFEIDEEEKLDLLRRLHNRTIASKMMVMGSRTSLHFEFLTDMDSYQILELVKNESITVKAVVLTQCETQKRVGIFQHLDDDTRMKLLSELSRIDHLPKDYIANVAQALKRKRAENPKLNTEALPGSDVLVTLLEKADYATQKSIVTSLESQNSDSARIVKGRLVSVDTLRYMPDGGVMELINSLKHEELLTFLAGSNDLVADTVLGVAPESLSADLTEELQNFAQPSREAYQSIERKIVNRIKIMAQEGKINLYDINEKMFGFGPDSGTDAGTLGLRAA